MYVKTGYRIQFPSAVHYVRAYSGKYSTSFSFLDLNGKFARALGDYGSWSMFLLIMARTREPCGILVRGVLYARYLAVDPSR
jgi:hypothetical protein